MRHEPFSDWAALYAVGALDGDELSRFESHLAAGCTTCDQLLYQWSAVAALLPRALPNVPLRPEVREGLMKRLAADRVPRASATGRRRTVAGEPAAVTTRRTVVSALRGAWPWAGSAMAAGLVGILVWNLYETSALVNEQHALIRRFEGQLSSLGAELNRQQAELVQTRAVRDIVWNKDAKVAPLVGTEAAARAEGLIVWSPGIKRGSFVVHFLPMLPPDMQYQLWAISGQKAQSGGVFSVDEVGHNAFVVPIEAARPERFEITLEPFGGVATPTGPVVMTGR